MRLSIGFQSLCFVIYKINMCCNAALEIGGTTIHSASRIGIPLIPEHFGRMWSVRKRWRNLKVLIIDEISMISAEMLEYLEQTVRAIRATIDKDDDEKDLPFGGIQVLGLRMMHNVEFGTNLTS